LTNEDVQRDHEHGPDCKCGEATVRIAETLVNSMEELPRAVPREVIALALYTAYLMVCKTYGLDPEKTAARVHVQRIERVPPS
jgi:hypothetical protein